MLAEEQDRCQIWDKKSTLTDPWLNPLTAPHLAPHASSQERRGTHGRCGSGGAMQSGALIAGGPDWFDAGHWRPEAVPAGETISLTFQPSPALITSLSLELE
jgi:hypothetical protein